MNLFFNIVYPLSRWLHMVGMTLIVGGTLFFELVLPIAIEDLKREQLLTIGRAPPENPVRWMKLNLMVLLVAIFLGSAMRHVQLSLAEQPREGKIRSADG